MSTATWPSVGRVAELTRWRRRCAASPAACWSQLGVSARFELAATLGSDE